MMYNIRYTAVLWFIIFVYQQTNHGITALGRQCTQDSHCTAIVPHSECNSTTDMCECSSGYVASGLNSNIRCLAVQCERPSDIPNGVMNVTSTSYQGTSTYTCNYGFSLDGGTTRICQANGSWNGTDPTCIRVTLGSQCSTDSDCNNTFSNSTCDSSDECACVPGYLESPDKTTCIIANCGNLTSPTDGSVDTTAGTTFGSSATYSCTATYEVNGNTTVTCLASGRWSNTAPTCEPDCAAFTIPNSQPIVYAESPSTFESTATVSCDPGYDINGSSAMTCISGGVWDPEPTCEPKDCGALAHPANGSVDTSAGTTYGDTATYSCDNGHTLNGTASVTCQASGQWTDSAPTCEPDCGSLLGAPPLQVNETGTTYQHTATYSCDVGYSLDGDSTRECQADGDWDGAAPTCIACDSDHWGANCSNTFTCNSTYTDSKSPISGCVCKPGWMGTNCDTDIDECAEGTHDCPLNSYCNNTLGKWRCTCNAGYDTHIGGCTARVGAACTNIHQQCVGLEDSVCDNITSTCTCTDGHYAEVDSNECTQATVGANCSQISQLCTALNNSVCDNATTTCTCTEGYYGQTGAVACTPARIGADCSVIKKLCSIIPYGVCDNSTLQCKCSHGYSESTDNTTCTDIDECATSTPPCIQNCTNTDGSHTCLCDTGYSGSGNNCTPCDCNHWGDNCTNPFTCEYPNTRSRSPTSGCVCKDGWRGTDCDVDIDECAEDTHDCPLNSYCDNTLGGWTCTCYEGYRAHLGDCPACSSHTYGIDCSSECDCVVNNTVSTVQSCNHVNGTCMCGDGWTGERCDVDINECLINTHDCKRLHEGCHNTLGLYECSCERGYHYNNDNTCVIDTSNGFPPKVNRNESFIDVSMFVKLNISLPAVNLNLSMTYGEYREELESKIKGIYQKQLPETPLDVIILDIRNGSLLINYTLILPTNAVAAVTVVNTDIARGNLTVDVFGEVAVVFGMVVEDGEVSTGTAARSPTNICKMFTLTNGPCQSREQCVLSTNNEPTCQIAKTDDNFQLIVGLGVGLPMSLIMLLIIAIIFISYFMHRVRPASTTTTTTDRDTSDPSQLAEGTSTQFGHGAFTNYPFYWGRPGDDFSSIPSGPALHGQFYLSDAYGAPRSKASWELYHSRHSPTRKIERPKVHSSRANDMEPRL